MSNDRSDFQTDVLDRSMALNCWRDLLPIGPVHIMYTDPAGCFDALASDARWRAFTPEEQRKVDAFVCCWGIKPGDRVLEPGCGTGRLTAVLADLTGPAGRVAAVDCSPEFLRLAAQRRLPPHVTLHAAWAEAMPLAPESFDHVVCFNVFPHFVPPAVIVRRLVAALRPGAAFWIAHTCSRAAVNAAHRRGPPALRDHILPTPRKLARLLCEAGLKEVEIEDGADHFLARAVRPASEPAIFHAASPHISHSQRFFRPSNRGPAACNRERAGNAGSV